MHNIIHARQQIAQCRQMAQQLIQQTQQSNGQYRQMLQQAQQNAAMLQQLAQRELQAVQTIQTALQGHDMALQRLQMMVNLCTQMEQELINATAASASLAPSSQPQGYAVYAQ